MACKYHHKDTIFFHSATAVSKKTLNLSFHLLFGDIVETFGIVGKKINIFLLYIEIIYTFAVCFSHVDYEDHIIKNGRVDF